MKIIKGDTVKIISGKDRGVTGEVIRVYPKMDKIVVKDVNVVKRHLKARGQDKPAGILEFELPIHVSNVMVLDQKSGKPARIGYEIKDGKKNRIFKVGKTKLTKSKTK